MTSLRKWCKGLNQISKSYCLILGSDRRAAHRKPAKVTRHNLLLIVQLECKHAILFLLLFSHSVMSDSATLWTAACQASLSFTISQSLLNLMSIEEVMLSNHLILCHPLFILPSIFPRVFLCESVGSSHEVVKIMSHKIYTIHLREFEDNFFFFFGEERLF